MTCLTSTLFAAANDTGIAAKLYLYQTSELQSDIELKTLAWWSNNCLLETTLIRAKIYY